jgi:hypothetical protein
MGGGTGGDSSTSPRAAIFLRPAEGVCTRDLGKMKTKAEEEVEREGWGRGTTPSARQSQLTRVSSTPQGKDAMR